MVRTLSVAPWDVNPIPTAINFFRSEPTNLVLPGAAGSTVKTTLGGAVLQLPRNNVASIQAISIFCDAPTLLTSIKYTARQNEGPIQGLENLSFPPQLAGFVNFPFPGPFNVYQPGAYIDVLITRVTADVASNVNVTFVGWYCTPQDVQRWTGQQPGMIG